MLAPMAGPMLAPLAGQMLAPMAGPYGGTRWRDPVAGPTVALSRPCLGAGSQMAEGPRGMRVSPQIDSLRLEAVFFVCGTGVPGSVSKLALRVPRSCVRGCRTVLRMPGAGRCPWRLAHGRVVNVGSVSTMHPRLRKGCRCRDHSRQSIAGEAVKGREVYRRCRWSE